MEPPLGLERFPPQLRLEPRTARSVGLCLTHLATRAPEIVRTEGAGQTVKLLAYWFVPSL